MRLSQGFVKNWKLKFSVYLQYVNSFVQLLKLYYKRD